MKTIHYFLIGLLCLTGAATYSQVEVNVNVGTAPDWGPVTTTTPEYYYIPDIETYYDVRKMEFIYDNNGDWLRANALPATTRSYDLYKGYKIVLDDYRGDTPYDRYTIHKVKYPKGYKGPAQKNVGVRPADPNKKAATSAPGKNHKAPKAKAKGKYKSKKKTK